MPKKTRRTGNRKRDSSAQIDSYKDLARLLLKEGYKSPRKRGKHIVFVHTVHKDLNITVPKGKEIKPYLADDVAKKLRLIHERDKNA